MATASSERFQQMLIHRLDALQIALDKFIDHDAAAPATIRSLATSLLALSDGDTTPAMARAATGILGAPDTRLQEAVTALVCAMRKALAKPTRSATILIVGGSPLLNDCLVERLATGSRRVLCAWTGGEAREILKRDDVVFIILNLLLPDMDGKTLLTELRESPATATLPLLVVDEIGAGDWIKNNGLLLGADGYIARPIDMDVITEQVRSLLRRAHHTVNGPRRDPLTGLLNRAALRESHRQALKTCRDAGEPLSLVLLTITGDDSVTHTSPSWDATMQQAGLILSGSLRSTDMLARWGANEFAILLPGTDRPCAITAAEKVRKNIEGGSWGATDGAPPAMRVCVGVTELLHDDGFDAAMDKADKCLFAAQAQGGGVVSDDSAAPASPRRALLLHELRTARVLKQLLINQGLEVMTIDNVPSGFTALPDTKRPHLVVIDEQANSGGLDALAAFRAVRAYDRVPILMLLRPDSEAGLLKALTLGASDYLTSPFSPSVFLSRVRRLLSRGTSTVQPSVDICDVLIADNDTTTLIKAASALYQHGGFSIGLARGADETIARLHAEKPRAVILDPGVGQEKRGASFLDMILAEIDPDRTAIIATLSKDCPAEEADKISPRVAGVIRRPFNLLSLAHDVEQILHVTVSGERPPGAAKQLSHEIQRLLQPAPARPERVSA